MGGYGLIGCPLEHSFSPALHAELGLADYALYPLEPDRLEAFIRSERLDGFNVTIPYKTAVLPLCRRLTDRAKAVGSVNTMVRLPEGGYLGDNTDYAGFLYLLGSDGAARRGQKALVLGTGGASKAVCAALSGVGIPYVTISRTGADNYENLERHADAALLVNATPVGMYPGNGASPVDLRCLPKLRLVLDLIYNPSRTALLLQAEALGIPCRNGLAMLAAQAASAEERFLGCAIPPERTAAAADAIRRRTENAVLIGMPGCGKSSVGRALARLTGRDFLDTDEMVAQSAGMPVPELIAARGEAAFRALETEAVRQAGKRSGTVIAAGGGVVTQPENLPLLRQNGVLVFLERPLAELETAGRPLSQLHGVEQLARERLPLYQAWSSVRAAVSDPEATANAIRKELGI